MPAYFPQEIVEHIIDHVVIVNTDRENELEGPNLHLIRARMAGLPTPHIPKRPVPLNRYVYRSYNQLVLLRTKYLGLWRHALWSPDLGFSEVDIITFDRSISHKKIKLECFSSALISFDPPYPLSHSI